MSPAWEEQHSLWQSRRFAAAEAKETFYFKSWEEGLVWKDFYFESFTMIKTNNLGANCWVVRTCRRLWYSPAAEDWISSFLWPLCILTLLCRHTLRWECCGQSQSQNRSRPRDYLQAGWDQSCLKRNQGWHSTYLRLLSICSWRSWLFPDLPSLHASSGWLSPSHCLASSQASHTNKKNKII